MSNQFYYKQYGNFNCGFMMDGNGTPYLLAYVSYRGSDNLLDNYRDDRGREFQSCLLDGFIDHAAGDDFYVNTTNPTYGGGNYGDAVPNVSSWNETLATLEAIVPAYDYMPENFGGVTKDYKARMLGDHYPECGWFCRTKYTIGSNYIHMEVEYYISDKQSHYVYFFRPMVLHLNPKLFQYPLENEDKRDSASWLQAVILDDKIKVKSVDNKIVVTAMAGVDPADFSSVRKEPYFSHRCFRQANPTVQNKIGTADVWEAMYVIEPMLAYDSTHKFRGWARIDVQPTIIKFDLAKMIKNLFSAMNERKKTMKIMCDNGSLTVTDNQYQWLDFTDSLVDMSAHPAPAGTAYFNGTVTDLNNLLVNMPVGWTPPIIEVPVITPPDPVVDGFEEQVLEKLDRILEILEGGGN